MSVQQLNSQSAFCLPLPGKPNPFEPSSPDSARSRVVQKGQTGDDCSYYALQILRDERRIGKKPHESQMKERECEIAFSTHRKTMTRITAELQPQVDLAIELSRSQGTPCTKKIAAALLTLKMDQFLPASREIARQALKDFCAQNKFDVLTSYTENALREAKMKNNIQLFVSLKVPGLKLADALAPSYFQKPWEELTIDQKEILEENVIFSIQQQAYQTQSSSWHPDQPPDQLLKQLQMHGPHLIKGIIGHEAYEEKPIKLEMTIEGRDVFTWDPNAKKKPFSKFHCVVLVGVEIENSEAFVYYVDPEDGSDPSDIKSQKIYRMSYEVLKSAIASLNGMKMVAKDGTPVFQEESGESNNYALFISHNEKTD